MKMLRKGCERFLAYVLNDSHDGINLGNIPVVREFPDVFPKDLNGLPSI